MREREQNRLRDEKAGREADEKRESKEEEEQEDQDEGKEVDGQESFVCGKLYPLLPRLSFTVHRDEQQTRTAILRDRHIYYYSTQFHELYDPYCDDFGPVRGERVPRK